MSIKIMIADDHSMIREGLRSLLELEEEIEVIAEAENGEDCLNKINMYNPDVLLLDIDMPKKNGLQVLKSFQEQEIIQKVLVLTVHDQIEYLMEAMESGANGYILKDSEFKELKKAILAIWEGKTYIPSTLLPLMESKMLRRNADAEKIDNLTKRELEVLKLLAVGMYNKEVAQNLDISERTVKNHVSNIFKKLEVTDRTQAAVFAIRNKLIKI